ncbi:HtaA domain-containing protein [Actinokineospora inagensis]|uniref:HtaA domain-containing protein n=1 Tax=Actinokineospora inagensis TaxID=103730 RepID=UPI0003F93E37|nr:HtaA domain-containing protein [Actinokineospora inagensis]
MSIPVVAGLIFLAAAQGPTTTTTPAVAPGCDLTTATAQHGDLLWGFKKSFRQYVGSGSGNSITATNGATITTIDEALHNSVPTGAYRFTFGSAEYTSPSQFTVHYKGTVTFSYPAHFFTLLLSNPSVTTGGGSATLHADVELKASPGSPSPSSNLPNVDLAHLAAPAASPVNGLLMWSDVPGTLTSAEAFAGFYQAGAPLDPVTLTLAADCASTPKPPPTATPAPAATAENLVPTARYRPTTSPTTTGEALAATGVDAEHGLWAGVVLLLTGLSLVLAAYRPRPD